jgi:hypothetical protein
MMFDKDQFLQIIAHASCSEGKFESSILKAFKIDDSDGIAIALGFKANMISKVDYFVSKNNDVQLIELSDLEKRVQSCLIDIDKELGQLKDLNDIKGEPVTKREEKDIKNRAWKDTKDEFHKKWSGSIAVIERLYRKTGELGDADPSYRLLIICKDHTDVRMLDALKTQLSGMMSSVVICTTKTLSAALIEPSL